MKVLLADTKQTINVASITKEHIVVFLLGSNNPFMLTSGNHLNRDGYKFIRLVRPASTRQVGIYPGASIQACVKRALDAGQEVQAFVKWQEAFDCLVKTTEACLEREQKG